MTTTKIRALLDEAIELLHLGKIDDAVFTLYHCRTLLNRAVRNHPEGVVISQEDMEILTEVNIPILTNISKTK